MKKTLRTLVLGITLASAGCMALPPQPHLADSNPASPNAPEASFRPATAFLMSGNNYAMSPEGEGQPMQMEMKMDMPNMPEHGAQPPTTSQHEGHETPSATPKTHEHSQDNAPKQ